MSILTPDKQCRTIFDIELDELRRIGIRGIIVDLDNTLVAWHSEDVPLELEDWIAKVVASGCRVCILSNAGGRRANRTAAKLSLPVVAPARKPFRRGFLKCVAALNLPREQIAMVGDQLFMDIMGGNRAGLYTIMVNPISPREFWATRVIRLFERRLISRP